MTDAFNLFSLNAPTSALNSPIFGQIRTANPMRQVQTGAIIATLQQLDVAPEGGVSIEDTNTALRELRLKDDLLQ